MGGADLSNTGQRVRLGVLLLSLLLLCLLIFSYFHHRLAPLLLGVAESRAYVLFEEATSRALLLSLDSAGTPFIHCTYDDAGRLSLITCDSARIGRLRAELGRTLLDELSRERYTEFDVPLGNLIGSGLFFGKGPALTVRFVPASSVTVDLADEFLSAGINQTMFSLSAVVTLRACLLLYGYTHEVTLTLSLPLEQIVLSGQVPQVYLSA